MREPPPVVTFPLRWERERAMRLHRACKTIERRSAAGMPVRKAVQYFAWFWKDRTYRTAPHIKTRFGKATLVTLYYHWLRNGKSPSCFVLHYAARLAPLRAGQVRRFMGACGKAGTVSSSRTAPSCSPKRSARQRY